MPRAYSRDLRERVSRFVDAGHSRHAAAAHFGVSVSFVRLMQVWRRSGRLDPKPRRRAAAFQARPATQLSASRIGEKDDITMPELSAD
ncbi:hypothetical protein GOD00_23335 [Sinorhizobium medicae]|nr:hypothetical protein [Sinorhizobium medicae]